MKKILFSALGLLLMQLSFGQAILNIADIASDGDVVVNASSDLQNMIPQPGNAQTYNFLGVQPVGVPDTSFYLNPASTPFGAAMSGSNLVSKTGNAFTYFEKSAAGLYLTGSVFNTAGLTFYLPFEAAPLRFNQKMPVFTFPATLGMNLKAQTSTRFTFRFDTVVTVGIFQATVDSVRITGLVSDTSLIDGYGQAQFLAGNFDCLRNVQSLRIKFSAEVRASIFGSAKTWTSYPLTIPDFYSKQIMLWTNGKKAPLVTITFDEAGSLVSSSIQKMLITQNKPLSGSAQGFEFTPYPNPAADVLLFNSQKNLKSLRIFTLEGKKISDVNLTLAQKTVQLEKISNGIYWIEAETHEGFIARKKLIINK